MQSVDLAVSEAASELARDSAIMFIDVRREDEVAGLTADGATHIPRDMLELELGARGVAKESRIFLLCQSGARSRFAAEAMRHFGYENTWSVQGGFSAWKGGEFPTKRIAYLDHDARQRYARHLSLADIGIEGQARLAQAKIAIVGAGGLGSPAALYLAAMGVGHLRLIDDDAVELSNLQRQVIHSEATLGQPKVASAAQTLNGLNSAITVEPVARRLDDSSGDLISDCDLVINGADNFKARFALNDLCLKHGIPLIDGAVLEMEGQLSVFCHKDGPCYRCLYPEVPPTELAPSCAAAGVLGVVPGIIGMLQALEAAKLIVGFGEPCIGKLLVFDATTSAFDRIEFDKRSGCSACGP